MKKIILRLKNLIFNLGSLAVIFPIFLMKDFLSSKKQSVSINKITWFGAYGNGNLGDDLIFYSLKRLLNKNDIEINLSIRDFEKAKNYGVQLFSKGEQFFDFWSYKKRIKECDAVFLGGGGLLEYYYPSKQAYRMLLIYLCPLMLARIYGKPSYVVGMGVNSDKIQNSFFRFIYRSILSSCKLIITRDEKSKNGLIGNGVETNIIASFDPVLSLDLPLREPFDSNKKTIGFLLWPYFLWPHFYENAESLPESKRKKHENFVEQLQQSIKTLSKEYNIKLLTFHFSDTILYKELEMTFEEKASLGTFLKSIAQVDLVVSMRYHGIITSVLNEIPVISIDVQQKMDAIMRNYDLYNYNIKVDDFSKDTLLSKVKHIEDNNVDTLKKIQDKNKEVKQNIRKSYSEIL
ncbi:polysaccharide pyruvyl transferase family protein [Flammeovirga yaeyamensis]|uniref:Polysaccharide pyruvyl transferase family protein n=1 Tax=Flammeovirga yaeyamensis TaxID=367791 RepID=A0AAX1N448_9BACT|nr:polysaccharide pyruvyl transferase family protein [Flammeovirga yaeyamensis]MBB3699812.1 polysaccharide pyruvyl transferase WcaK-like protein [Flammeovirga yaeyamensis]NMF36619.1 hypothetical protein [Flammeovirga yaeyamensis]QWG02334.1 polysaccharide pyruvyl transferase family protein [Flammeovirga yaeyamensis]